MRVTQVIYLIFIIPISFCFAEKGFTHLATISGDSTGDRYSVVCGGGDVNGDGYNDFIVGAPGGNYAELFLGGPDFDTIPEIVFETNYNTFGHSVSIEGDLNNDGYDDIVIGSPNFDYGGHGGINTAGIVSIYYGGSMLDTIADQELVVADLDANTGWFYQFGKKVLSGVDINGDGYDDLIVSAPHDDIDAHGRVYIYFGGPDFDDKYDILLEGEDHFDFFGVDLDDVGDVNKDGINDIIIGADQKLSTKPSHTGKAYLIYGGEEINLDSSTVFYGDSINYPHGYFGRYVAGLGDVDGDNYPDIGIVGGDYVQVISGKDNDEIITIKGQSSFQYIGKLNNINKDKYNDFATSIYWEKPLPSGAGKVYIYFGDDEIVSSSNYEIDGKSKYHYFGKEVEYIGDINNDTNPEIIISECKIGNTDGRGKVYVYSYGNLNLIDDIPEINTNFKLKQNYPNPFNSKTKIQYYIPKKCNMELSIYDFLGQKIKTLESGYKSYGHHSVDWNGKDESGMNVSSGIYFYKLITNNSKKTHTTKKMIYLK